MSRRALVITLLLIGLGAGFRSQPARAFPAFNRRFDGKYLVRGTPLYEAYAGRSSCNVCHVGGAMNREHRNEYGQALDRLLDRADAEALSIENAQRNPRAARAATARIDSALATVEMWVSAAGPTTSGEGASGKSGMPTFGQLIRDGKLPR
jgi:hypothetical protein